MDQAKPVTSTTGSLKANALFRRSEAGQGMVELAISMIIILIVLAGLVDLSRTIITKMSLQDAAEEGVIYAMAYPKNCTQIQYRVLQNLSKVKNITLSSVVIKYDGVACPSSGDLTGDLITVSITNSFPVSMPFLATFIGSTRNIAAEAKGVVINSP